MLLLWVTGYLLVTILIGVYTSRYIHNSSDFILAGRRLPFSMATATVFATWFGSETILGASVEMAKHGLSGVIEEPFGAALCLVLVGLFFARPLYRKGYLTFGDYYRDQYGKKAETVAAICLILSYFGWIAAQMVALGLILQQVTGLSTELSIVFTAVIVTVYTYMGGMWAVSLTDSIQMLFIVIGLAVSVWFVIPSGGIEEVLASTPPEFFRFFPEATFNGWVLWLGALLTLGLGSIPQQDVFQRVMSSRTEKIAVWSSLSAGVLYLTIAILPLFLGLVARYTFQGEISQDMVPRLVTEKTPFAVQVVFLGALMSAILSTASGGILAPSSILSENLVKPFVDYELDDSRLLYITRISILVISFISLLMALYQRNIYELVAGASALSLVSLFVPLVAGLFFKNRSQTAAVLSMFLGMSGWLLALYLQTQIPEIFYGLAFSFFGYITGIWRHGK